jgi:hypothetical protein
MNTTLHTVLYVEQSFPVQRRWRAKRSRSHGALLVETLIGLFVGLLTGAALLALLQISMTSRSASMGVVNSDEEARAQLETISDRLRNSQSVVSGSTQACFSAASTSDITCYTDSSGDTLRIWLDTTVSPAALKQTQTTSGVATTTTLYTGVTSLQFYYYAQASSAYNSPLTSWLSTLNPLLPTLAEIPTLGAVKITLSTSVNGNPRTLTSLVRFRNSPYS